MPAVLTLMALLAQASMARSTDPQLERIREAVAERPAITIPTHPDETGRPVFRVKVEAWVFTYKPWEEPTKGVPSYVRPSMPLAHYEFLRMATPQAFWASTLYPGMIGGGFDPVIFKNLYKSLHATWQEREARAEVRRDLDAYLRSRGEVR
jgi:hypothetical protein